MIGRTIAVCTLACLLTSASQAQIRITEWEYNGLAGTTAGEFVELMNVGTSPIDMTLWSYDDSSRTAGSFSLAAFGIVQPKEIVILAETTEADFRAKWNLPAAIKVIGGSSQNLSRDDEINIYDNTNTLVDRLTYDDEEPEDMPSIRTQGISGNPLTLAALGANDKFQWVLSAMDDNYGSYNSTEGNRGNPGIFTLIPEPGSLGLLLLGLIGFFGRRPIR